MYYDDTLRRQKLDLTVVLYTTIGGAQNVAQQWIASFASLTLRDRRGKFLLSPAFSVALAGTRPLVAHAYIAYA